jgi:hypothetical protein
MVIPLEYAGMWRVEADRLALALPVISILIGCAFDDARLVLFASLNPSKENGAARTNFLRAPAWTRSKPMPWSLRLP